MSDHLPPFSAFATLLVLLLVPLSFLQKRTLVPKFEGSARLHDLKFIRHSRLTTVLGPWLRGVFYSMQLTSIWLHTDAMLRRSPLHDDIGSRSEFLGHFSGGDIFRSVIFSLFSLAFLVSAVISGLTEAP